MSCNSSLPFTDTSSLIDYLSTLCPTKVGFIKSIIPAIAEVCRVSEHVIINCIVILLGIFVLLLLSVAGFIAGYFTLRKD
jgi:cadmium resistance protein CadD (predicted permease)